MQHAAECDEQGRLNYAMCAINPCHVGKTFDDAALCEIVNTISNNKDCLWKSWTLKSKCINNFSCRYVVADMLGPTMCVRKGACFIANSHKCPQLSQGAES